MKTIILFVFLLLASFLGVQSGLRAAIIADDAVIGASPFGSSSVLYLSKSIPPGQGMFAIDIQETGPGQYLFSASGIAEKYALFAAAPGDFIDATFALNTTPLVSNNGTDYLTSQQTFAPNESKLFAYWDDRLNGGSVPDAADLYGWVSITLTGSGLVVSHGATSTSGGIFAGSVAAVPEPSALALLAVLAVILFLSPVRRAVVP